jgi:hypothetical protein
LLFLIPEDLNREEVKAAAVSKLLLVSHYLFLH